jgi:hypothetical protein
MVWCHNQQAILIALRSTEYLYSTVGDQGSNRTQLTRRNTTVSSFRVSFVYATRLCTSNANYCSSSSRNVTRWQFALTLWQRCFRHNNTLSTLYLPARDCVTSLSLATRQAMLHKETSPLPPYNMQFCGSSIYTLSAVPYLGVVLLLFARDRMCLRFTSNKERRRSMKTEHVAPSRNNCRHGKARMRKR